MSDKVVPNPGSDEAIKLGCTCPALDNEHGRGFPYGGEICFYRNMECKLHYIKEPKDNPED